VNLLVSEQYTSTSKIHKHGQRRPSAGLVFQNRQV